MATASSHTGEAVGLPETRGAAQQILRRHGLKGLSIDSLGRRGDLVLAWCLTAPRLSEQNEMRRVTKTVAILLRDGALIVEPFDGWLVDVKPESLTR